MTKVLSQSLRRAKAVEMLEKGNQAEKAMVNNADLETTASVATATCQRR